jgi:hypothetical protein
VNSTKEHGIFAEHHNTTVRLSLIICRLTTAHGHAQYLNGLVIVYRVTTHATWKSESGQLPILAILGFT